MNKLAYHLSASGLFTSFCLSSQSACTYFLCFHIQPDWHYLLFLFAASLLFYNLHKIKWYGYSRTIEGKVEKYKWVKEHPTTLLLILFISYLCVAALYSFALDGAQIILFIITGMFAMIYNLPIKGLVLRNVKGLKAFYISFICVSTGVIIPLFSGHQVNILLAFSFVAAQFLFVTALCIAVDIRDVEEDKEDGVNTFPLFIGLKASKKLIHLLFFLYFSFFVFGCLNGVIKINELEVAFIIALLSAFYVQTLKPESKHFHFSLGVDGLILLQTIAFGILFYAEVYAT